MGERAGKKESNWRQRPTIQRKQKDQKNIKLVVDFMTDE